MKIEEILRIDKPILFNTEMVRAILEDRKTVTRRLIKEKDITNRFDIDVDGKVISYIDQSTGDHYPPYYPCRYKPGDYLYVRETFSIIRKPSGEFERYVYKATDKFPFGYTYVLKFRWRPSIHMPKEAARIFLRVTDVRVERLRDIDNDGALKEGCDGRCSEPADGALSDCQKDYDFSVEKFESVWDSTIKPADRDKYGWNANPWVWVIEFERVEVE